MIVLLLVESVGVMVAEVPLNVALAVAPVIPVTTVAVLNVGNEPLNVGAV